MGMHRGSVCVRLQKAWLILVGLFYSRNIVCFDNCAVGVVFAIIFIILPVKEYP